MDPRDPDYIEIVIRRLEKLEAPSRHIDGQIASILGFEKRPGPNGKPLWIVPAGDKAVDIPEYTGNLDAAYELSQMVWPDNICAVSWNPARAQFEGQPAHSAATPEIAICLAAMALKLKMELSYAAR